MMMQVSSTQSRARGIPFSTLSLSSPTIISSSNSRSLSVCSFCRTFQPNKVTINCLILSAMSNACITRFSRIHHKAVTPFSSKTRHENGICRKFSTCTAPLISKTAPLIVRSPSSLVVVSSLTPNDTLQRSDEWFALRRDKLTTSTFSTALGFWKGSRRAELWHEKVFASEVQPIEGSKRFAMEWGVLNEGAAIDRYKSITGRDVSSLGFAVHAEERLGWVGASPDGLLGCFPGGGILEVKCPYNKGKPETALPWSTMPFYYMPQVQGQMEVMNREWVDLYCWTPNGSTIFRICRERDYWELIHGVLHEFWWENVIPARQALAMGREEEAKSYKPTSTHRRTGLAIVKSMKLATEAKLLCREIAGHVEFFR
ncbi:uncharacterized protein LOC116128517 [Pistacia vera]|uniref:uncharacterized protein LOC116128508 n=1 Tax=Pistacia vera TaxID=55513 RepID=UPI00126357F3|nr:uncharacterized protein LOC116128508 [Pistacia vera]XP_031270089.1 uncharacterized protein LOC116128517 [Pistacia vera]